MANYNCLILAPWYIPHDIISWEDAVTMKWEETAEVLAEYPEYVCSPSVTWKYPAVMRLKWLPSNIKRVLKFSRPGVFRRDGYQCQYCGQYYKKEKLELEHVQPKSRGGRKTWENSVAACSACNKKKRDRTPQEAGMTLLRQPKVPRGPIPFFHKDFDNVPEEWKPYVSMAT